jgi:hypothetical protein
LLTRNHRQEALCRAYVLAIAARCGMSVSVANPDYGIDLTLNDIVVSGDHHAESGYKIDIQAKSATLANLSQAAVRYDLDVRAYETLRQPKPGNPRILVVLLLPEDEKDWSVQTEDELILRRCAYWLSLRGRPATANRRSIRLAIPRVKLFSIEALQRLLDRIKKGQDL